MIVNGAIDESAHTNNKFQIVLFIFSSKGKMKFSILTLLSCREFVKNSIVFKC